MEEVFQDIVSSFNSLWSMKIHGTTLELITPFSSTTNSFVSVFITRQNDTYIVTDGGWIQNQAYEVTIDLSNDPFNRLFQYYCTQYRILHIEQRGTVYYYKKTKDKRLIPNLVYDVSNFIAAIISGSAIQFTDLQEKQATERFSREANAYLSSFIPSNKIKHNSSFTDSNDYKSIKFNSVIISSPERLSLVSYVTGSSINYFISSLTKACTNFDIVNDSSYKSYIDKKIVVINDQAQGYAKNKMYKYLEQIQTKTGRPNINWSERESLKVLLS